MVGMINLNDYYYQILSRSCGNNQKDVVEWLIELSKYTEKWANIDGFIKMFRETQLSSGETLTDMLESITLIQESRVTVS